MFSFNFASVEFIIFSHHYQGRRWQSTSAARFAITMLILTRFENNKLTCNYVGATQSQTGNALPTQHSKRDSCRRPGWSAEGLIMQTRVVSAPVAWPSDNHRQISKAGRTRIHRHAQLLRKDLLRTLAIQISHVACCYLQ